MPRSEAQSGNHHILTIYEYKEGGTNAVKQCSTRGKVDAMSSRQEKYQQIRKQQNAKSASRALQNLGTKESLTLAFRSCPEPIPPPTPGHPP